MKPIDPVFVVSTVCRYIGVSVTEIRGHERFPLVVLARAMCSYIMHEHCGLSYPQIAAILRAPERRKSHSTYVEGARRIARHLQSGHQWMGLDVGEHVAAMYRLLGVELREAA